MRRYNRLVGNRIKIWLTRLALFAVLLHAFAPVMSHAMMAKSGKSFAQICTAQGFQFVEVGADGSGREDAPGIKIGHHCAVCAMASAPPLPPSAWTAALPDFSGGHVVTITSSTFAFASALRLQPPSTGPPAS
jgi:ammonia channel protein AmtB